MNALNHKANQLITNQLSLNRKIIEHSSLMLAFLCLFLSLFLTPKPVHATPSSILIVTDNQTQTQRIISQQLQKTLLNNASYSVKIAQTNRITINHIYLAKPSLIITLGIHAPKLVSTLSTPVLYTLISEKNLHPFIPCRSTNTPIISTRKCYSIALDQPMARHFHFLSLLLPTAKKVGVLTASFSQHKLPELHTEIIKANLILKTRHVENNNMLNTSINALIHEIDVLFALPDPLIHNKHNIPNLLLSTYRYNIPVIGFSKSYVKAGAIAAIYSSPEQITQHIIELTKEIINTPLNIEKPHVLAKYFDIAINKSVAHSLELHLTDKKTIKSKLLQLEQ